MSAFLCTPEHIGALAAYAARKKAIIQQYSGSVNEQYNAEWCATMMADVNLMSVSVRYPKSASSTDWGYASADSYCDAAATYAKKYLYQPPRLSTIDMLKMLSCYEYQACEIRGWNDSYARQQCDNIRANLIRELDGYDNAVYAFQEAK